MLNDQNAVEDFHRKFGSTIGETPELRDRELRAKLILEEAVETCAALGFSVWANIEEPGDPGVSPHKQLAYFHKAYDKPDFVEVIDGLADVIYVVLGAAVTFGINLEPFFEEVHRSNMAKEQGGVRGDGKILKPAGWQPPALEEILEVQRACTKVKAA